MRKLNSRTVHRYLSIVIGIQLMFWTISGMIFSWNPIKMVRGEHLVRESVPVDLSQSKLLGLNDVMAKHAAKLGSGRVAKVELRTMLASPVYELTVVNENAASNREFIVDASTGELLSPISEDQARQIAISDFAEKATVVSAEWIESDLGGHSEYRGKELPVWRVVLKHESGTVIYVSANRGIVTTRRNNRWRIFDFFWMLHTMDYQGRDNFNTWLLRSFSIFGVATVLSGYWLWWRSSRIRKRWTNPAKAKKNAL